MLSRSRPETSNTTRPLSMTMVRLPKASADCMLWVIIRQVRPRLDTIVFVSASTFSAVAGSSAAVCSSSSSFGSAMLSG